MLLQKKNYFSEKKIWINLLLWTGRASCSDKWRILSSRKWWGKMWAMPASFGEPSIMCVFSFWFLLRCDTRSSSLTMENMIMRAIENLFYRFFPLYAMDARRMFHTYIGKVKIFRNSGTQHSFVLRSFRFIWICERNYVRNLSLSRSFALVCPKK